MELLVENEFGHGALKQKLDLRDQKYSKLAMSSQPFSWETGYDVEQEIQKQAMAKNQGPSFSCGGQAGSYYMAIIRLIQQGLWDECSAKFIYSQIFYPGGGTTMRDILDFVVNHGDCLEADLTSYEHNSPPSEAFMEDKKAIEATDTSKASTNKGLGYAFPGMDIDSVAQAMRDNHGALIQLDGWNNGTWLSLYPQAKKIGEAWSHFVYAGKAKLINGQKFIGIHNSWGTRTGDNGWQWVGEDYFKNGAITKVGVVYSKSSPVIIEKRISLIEQLLAKLQQLLNMIAGPTKLSGGNGIIKKITNNNNDMQNRNLGKFAAPSNPQELADEVKSIIIGSSAFIIYALHLFGVTVVNAQITDFAVGASIAVSAVMMAYGLISRFVAWGLSAWHNRQA